ncbi:putative sugar O-methyltransferase [Alloacidobacterium sp.]|uniref:putative sugar O-methyltransferase n=1 Tax=Alloacidobacterium sp. TaxID=2951999 RepID=UPI002D272E38|nr:putative sugar O-methyltransferase [Alloacidobacterium sp.]HYK36514.1 putative sugar O-methyltransferase [Alloacidobacterium sp.]
MRLKWKHLRHPLRTAILAGRVAAMHLDLRRFGNSSRRHFRGDPRFDLENVSHGFAPRVSDLIDDDPQVLERICASYNKAVRDSQDAPKAFQSTDWWQQIRQERLGPVMRALETCDILTLGGMYRNFFRDVCSTGLISVPYGMTSAFFGGNMRDIHRRYYLGDALYRIDHWATQTDSRFALRDLTGPEIGNPFGILIDGTLVRTGSPYQHYCALRIREHLASDADTVAEIGGGYGGMAYYLLRDHAGVKYLNFDVPESIALASYYLLKAFPHLNLLLYGEKEIARADVVLLPLFEMEKVQHESIDITFSSHAMSDLSDKSMSDYLKVIARFTKSCFFYIGNRRAAESISNLAAQKRYPYRLVETRTSGWHAHTHSDASEIECLYRVSGHVRTTVEYAGSGLAQATRIL